MQTLALPSGVTNKLLRIKHFYKSRCWVWQLLLYFPKQRSYCSLLRKQKGHIQDCPALLHPEQNHFHGHRCPGCNEQPEGKVNLCLTKWAWRLKICFIHYINITKRNKTTALYNHSVRKWPEKKWSLNMGFSGSLCVKMKAAQRAQDP